MQPPASVVIECSVALARGSIEVASLTAGSSSRPVHVSALAAALALPPQAHSKSLEAGNSCPALLSQLAAGPAAACNAPAATPAALAGLQTSTCRSGFWFDPAAFDSFLQLGQVFKAAGSSEVFVPAGMDALRVASPAGAGATSWAAAVPAPAAPGTVSTDFRLSSDSRQQQLCSISRLSAKSMGKAQAGAPAVKAAAAQLAECLYEVTWQAAEAAASEDLPGASKVWGLAPAYQQEPALAAASAIEAVQRLLQGAGSATAAACQLQTVGALLLPLPDSVSSRPAVARVAAAAALTGLVKTLGQEAPQLAWSSRDADGQAAAAPRAGSAALLRLPAGVQPASDAFGAANSAGTSLAPLLLKSAAVEQLGPHHLFPMPRGNLSSLAALPVDAGRKLAGDEVLVAVKAVGINFRQVFGGEKGPGLCT